MPRTYISIAAGIVGLIPLLVFTSAYSVPSIIVFSQSGRVPELLLTWVGALSIALFAVFIFGFALLTRKHGSLLLAVSSTVVSLTIFVFILLLVAMFAFPPLAPVMSILFNIVMYIEDGALIAGGAALCLLPAMGSLVMVTGLAEFLTGVTGIFFPTGVSPELFQALFIGLGVFLQLKMAQHVAVPKAFSASEAGVLYNIAPLEPDERSSEPAAHPHTRPDPVTHPTASPPSAARTSDAEREFRNVFAIRTQSDRERIIEFWQKKKNCPRDEAMMHAVNDVRQQNR